MEERPRTVRVIHPDEAHVERYRVILPRADGGRWKSAVVTGPEGRLEMISPETCDARGIRLSVVTLPPGTEDNPHWHVNGEKVMYIVQGKGHILAGDDLEPLPIERGDAVFVPPFASHAPVNDGDEPLVFVMVGSSTQDVWVVG
jgi:uncharacterized RmlC-like cupin family protein